MMTPEDVKTIREMQANLQRIQNTGTAPINITQYKKMGLIRSIEQYYTKASGEKIRLGSRLVLTDKGRRAISVLV